MTPDPATSNPAAPDPAAPDPAITVRHAEPDDAAALHRIMSGPRVVHGTLQLPYPSLERWRKRLGEVGEGFYPLVACADGEVVGNLSVQTFPARPRRRHVGVLGMAVRDDWQGRGVGTALMAAAVDLADAWLGLHRLELEVFEDNMAAIRLYRAFGFEIEGALRDFAWRDGRYVNALMMARLRP